MTATYTFDVFSSLDGFGAAGGNWTGYWGKQGPELLYQRMMHEIYAAQREALLQLRNSGEISSEVMRRVERELDLEESRLEV